jgi:Arc/MetJ-type ribon-helix-helix transcriptional regulator
MNTSTNRRINIVLPEDTIQSIDRMVKPGERSHFINDAVQYFVAHRGAEAMRTLLEQTTIRDRDLDLEIAAEWAAVDSETWQQLDSSQPLPDQQRSGAAKSTSRRSTPR